MFCRSGEKSSRKMERRFCDHFFKHEIEKEISSNGRSPSNNKI